MALQSPPPPQNPSPHTPTTQYPSTNDIKLKIFALCMLRGWQTCFVTLETFHYHQSSLRSACPRLRLASPSRSRTIHRKKYSIISFHWMDSRLSLFNFHPNAQESTIKWLNNSFCSLVSIFFAVLRRDVCLGNDLFSFFSLSFALTDEVTFNLTHSGHSNSNTRVTAVYFCAIFHRWDSDKSPNAILHFLNACSHRNY